MRKSNPALEVFTGLRRRTSTGKSTEGQAIVEITLLAAFLVLLLFAIIDFGRLFFHSTALAQAANAGAHYGAQSMGKSSDFGGMEQKAKDAAAKDLGTIIADNPSPSRYFLCSDNTKNNSDVPCSDGKPSQVYVQVTVKKTFDTLFKYPGIPKTADVSRTATMRVR
jgi:Flp pilus assembly protein TadG